MFNTILLSVISLGSPQSSAVLQDVPAPQVITSPENKQLEKPSLFYKSHKFLGETTEGVRSSLKNHPSLQASNFPDENITQSSFSGLEKLKEMGCIDVNSIAIEGRHSVTNEDCLSGVLPRLNLVGVDERGYIDLEMSFYLIGKNYFESEDKIWSRLKDVPFGIRKVSLPLLTPGIAKSLDSRVEIEEISYKAAFEHKDSIRPLNSQIYKVSKELFAKFNRNDFASQLVYDLVLLVKASSPDHYENYVVRKDGTKPRWMKIKSGELSLESPELKEKPLSVQELMLIEVIPFENERDFLVKGHASVLFKSGLFPNSTYWPLTEMVGESSLQRINIPQLKEKNYELYVNLPIDKDLGVTIVIKDPEWNPYEFLSLPVKIKNLVIHDGLLPDFELNSLKNYPYLEKIVGINRIELEKHLNLKNCPVDGVENKSIADMCLMFLSAKPDAVEILADHVEAVANRKIEGLVSNRFDSLVEDSNEVRFSKKAPIIYMMINQNAETFMQLYESAYINIVRDQCKEASAPILLLTNELLVSKTGVVYCDGKGKVGIKEFPTEIVQTLDHLSTSGDKYYQNGVPILNPLLMEQALSFVLGSSVFDFEYNGTPDAPNFKFVSHANPNHVFVGSKKQIIDYRGTAQRTLVETFLGKKQNWDQFRYEQQDINSRVIDQLNGGPSIADQLKVDLFSEDFQQFLESQTHIPSLITLSDKPDADLGLSHGQFLNAYALANLKLKRFVQHAVPYINSEASLQNWYRGGKNMSLDWKESFFSFVPPELDAPNLVVKPDCPPMTICHEEVPAVLQLGFPFKGKSIAIFQSCSSGNFGVFSNQSNKMGLRTYNSPLWKTLYFFNKKGIPIGGGVREYVKSFKTAPYTLGEELSVTTLYEFLKSVVSNYSPTEYSEEEISKLLKELEQHIKSQ